MRKMIFSAGLAISAFTCTSASAQQTDTLPSTPDTVHLSATQPVAKMQSRPEGRFHTTIAGIAVPAALMGYGFLALNNPTLRDLNNSTKDELKEDHPRFNTGIDNFLQFTPAVAVYVLNAAGVHGKHNFRDRTIILGISALFTAGSVEGIKHVTHEERPDGSDFYSFPSGHTATAFASAEFLRQEYKDVSPWIGVAGYAVATATGALRVYNNKHWVSDVIAGAGFGILSTKAAYWVYPTIQRWIFKEKYKSTAASSKVILPYYNPEFHSAGLSFIFFPR